MGKKYMRTFKTPKQRAILIVDDPENRMDVLRMKKIIESEPVYIDNGNLCFRIYFEDYIKWLEKVEKE